MFFSLFFFLMIRRPPRSTLFPTRRSSDLTPVHRGASKIIRLLSVSVVLVLGLAACGSTAGSSPPSAQGAGRSEEHTSELQSPDHPVSPLLLRKKKATLKSSSPRCDLSALH